MTRTHSVSKNSRHALAKLAVPATALLVTALAAAPTASASAHKTSNSSAHTTSNSSGSTNSGRKVSLTETGSTLLEPLFQIWTTAYQKKFPNVSIVPSGGGSGKGISDASSGVVDIGGSDAYLSSSDRSQYPGLQDIPSTPASRTSPWPFPPRWSTTTSPAWPPTFI